MRYPAPKALLEFLKPYDRSVRELALAVRDFVVPEMEPCIETIYDAYNAVAFGYGPTESHVDGAIHVAVYAKYVNLGFNQGAHMKDAAKLLKGTGNNVRHVTIKSMEDLKHPALRTYLQEARRRASARKAYPEGLIGVRSVVKPASATKRRPEQK